MKTPRIQFELNPALEKELTRLMELGGVRTKKELLNNAITLLEWAAREKLRGRSIGSVDNEGTFRELEMPFLRRVALSESSELRVAAGG